MQEWTAADALGDWHTDKRTDGRTCDCERDFLAILVFTGDRIQTQGAAKLYA